MLRVPVAREPHLLALSKSSLNGVLGVQAHWLAKSRCSLDVKALQVECDQRVGYERNLVAAVCACK